MGANGEAEIVIFSNRLLSIARDDEKENKELSAGVIAFLSWLVSAGTSGHLPG